MRVSRLVSNWDYQLTEKPKFLQYLGQTSHLCRELYDINVEPVWKDGITGKGVVVAILDDGLEWDHPDLKRNFNYRGSFDYNSKPYSKYPTPRWTEDNLNKHGTKNLNHLQIVSW